MPHFNHPGAGKVFLNDIIRSDAITTVAVIQDHVTAYLVAWRVEDEVHIGNLAVHPDFRKQGLATGLFEKMLLQKPEFKVVWLEVRVSNREAQNLYQKLGFKQISIRKNYYQIEKEDAVIMVKDLG